MPEELWEDSMEADEERRERARAASAAAVAEPGIQEQYPVHEHVHIELRGPDGELKDVRDLHNLITTVGKNAIMDQLLASPSITKPTHMAIGTGTTAAAAGDTTLQTELDRNALTSKTRSTNVVTFVGDWAAGDGTGAITEAGILNAASGGDLYSRAVFSVVNKGALDTLSISWTYTGG